MNPKKLQKHIFSTYINMRYGVAIIAILFPLLLWIGGEVFGLERQSSMSAYYHASLEEGQTGLMRNYFVGLLFMLGGIFYLYKGYTVKENVALNFAGIFAIGVAIFPMEWNNVTSSGVSLHGINAVLMFLCIAYVSIFCAPETLSQMDDVKVKAKFKRWYVLIGVSMILSPLLAWLFTVKIDQLKDYTFFAEMFGIWVFAIYWWVKSKEIEITNAEHKALTGK